MKRWEVEREEGMIYVLVALQLEFNSFPPTSAVADAPVGPSVPALAEDAPLTVNPSLFLNRWRKPFSPFAVGNNSKTSRYYLPSPLPSLFSPPSLPLSCLLLFSPPSPLPTPLFSPLPPPLPTPSLHSHDVLVPVVGEGDLRSSLEAAGAADGTPSDTALNL